ncbi:DUF4102 domain-containing protein [Rhizobacter sp. AJA081-3]|uniref:DUF4102 domain-containing protein n=1 Tax=Rhizobacter sp. AJA081-3 TaxID=2753607 RepID=UPI001ADF725B|nr:DUF4102 domain-containing protein [Rhizobacter sp. AJA081-3]
MIQLFRSSTVWVVDYRYEGRPRRWFKAYPAEADARELARAELADLYAHQAEIVAVRPATDEEERQYLHGDEPRNVLCPTGRSTRTTP